MAIVSTDLKYYLSGGAGNAVPDSSLGGVISTTEVVDNTSHNLFDQVSGAETTDGDTNYRCIYLKNTHGSLVLQSATTFLQSIGINADTDVSIGLAPEGKNGTAQDTADEAVEPSSVVWETGIGSANSLSLGDMGAGDTYPIWVRRVVGAASSAFTDDTFTIEFDGDTAA